LELDQDQLVLSGLVVITVAALAAAGGATASPTPVARGRFNVATAASENGQ